MLKIVGIVTLIIVGLLFLLIMYGKYKDSKKDSNNWFSNTLKKWYE